VKTLQVSPRPPFQTKRGGLVVQVSFQSVGRSLYYHSPDGATTERTRCCYGELRSSCIDICCNVTCRSVSLQLLVFRSLARSDHRRPAADVQVERRRSTPAVLQQPRETRRVLGRAAREGIRQVSQLPAASLSRHYRSLWVLGSRAVSVLVSGAEGPGFKSQPRRCRVKVLGKLFTPVVPLFTKQQNW